MANNFATIGEAFTQHYYTQFDNNRANLRSLYRDQSMLTFEGTAILGTDAIVQRLVNLPFQKIRRQIVTCDCQPTTSVQPNGIFIAVSGTMILDDDSQPVKFAQSFLLLPDATNPSNYWVHNDVFRLNYG